MKTEVLKHLDNSLPESAKGYLMSGYSIALEGWRRGLELSMKVIYEKASKIRVPVYTLSDGKKSYTFSYTRANLLSKEIREICKNKDKTKEMLAKAGVAVPIGEEFDKATPLREMIDYANRLEYPVVLKPAIGTGGKGVITNISSDEELVEAVNYVKKTLKLKGNLIIEKHFEGNDYRLYVVGDKVAAAYKRYPLHVTGNGKDSIKDLLEKKKEARKKNPSLATRSIKLDKETETLLKRKGYTLSTILKKGEVVALKSKNNVTAGGEAIDMTDELSDEIKEVAVRAMKAIPTMVQAGIDMMIDEEENEGVVLEINNRPHITAHLYPSVGKSRDIPAAIIDYFFPETKNYNKEKRRNMYFDFDTVFKKTYVENSIQEMKVRKIPGNIELKRFQLTIPEGERTRFKKWLQMSAKKNNISGFVKDFPGYLTIVFGGREKSLTALIEIINKRLKRAKFETTLVERKRTTPVMQGFYLLDNQEETTNEELPVGYKDKVNKLIQTVKESNEATIVQKPSDEEYEILRNQVKNLQERLRKYEDKDKKKRVERTIPGINEDLWFSMEPIKLYEKFKGNRMFSHMLSPIDVVQDINHIIQELKLHDRIILKFRSDQEKREPIFITSYDEGYVWVQGKFVEKINFDELKERLVTEITNQMTIQPFIASITKDERPFIIRMSFFKDNEHKWKLKEIGALIGERDSLKIKKNTSYQYQEVESFLEEQYGEELASEIKAELKAFSILFPERFQKSYAKQLNALEVDIGIDLNRKSWIFGVNISTESIEHEKKEKPVINNYAKCVSKEENDDYYSEGIIDLQPQTKRFIVTGKVQGVGYRKWARKQMEKLQLSGSARNMNDGSVEVIVTGNDQDIQKLKEDCLVGPKKAEVAEVRESNGIQILTEETSIHSYTNKKRTIGYLSKGTRRTSVKTACAFTAASKGINFFYFTPEGIDYENNMIKAYKIEGFSRKEVYVPYPDVIIDRLRGRRNNKYSKLYKEFSHIPMTNKNVSRVGNKHDDYKALQEIPELAQHLIFTKLVKDVEEVLYSLEEYKDIILKPVQSLGGKGVHYISKKRSGFEVIAEKSSTIINKEELKNYLQELLQRRYIIQPYINSRTKSGEPFDVRVHLMKNEKHQWSVAKTYARIGSSSGVVSNTSSGGYIENFDDFVLRQKVSGDPNQIQNEIEDLAIQFMNTASNVVYDESLSDVGLDLGWHNFEEWYLFEVNTYSPVSTLHEQEVGKYLVEYANSFVDERREVPESIRMRNLTGRDLSISNRMIVKEALKRGVKFKKLDHRKRFEMYNKEKKYIVKNGLVSTSYNSLTAVRITNDKEFFNQLLKNNGFSTPESKIFHADEREIAWEWAKERLPIVVKPNDGILGKLVFVKLNTYEEFKSCYEKIAKEENDILVEKFIEGEEYRFTFVKDEIVAVAKREPAHIVGNGASTVEELIKMKNIEREKRRNPLHKKLNINNESKRVLKKYGMSLESIPGKDKVVYLRENSNVSTGGDAIDFTDKINNNLKEVIENAVRSIPGLNVCGVDVLINGNDYHILEMNAHAMLAMHHFPWKGEPQDVISKLVDGMFPGTIEK